MLLFYNTPESLFQRKMYGILKAINYQCNYILYGKRNVAQKRGEEAEKRREREIKPFSGPVRGASVKRVFLLSKNVQNEEFFVIVAEVIGGSGAERTIGLGKRAFWKRFEKRKQQGGFA